MDKLTSFIKNFIEDESGLTAVEYAIAGGLVVGGMVTAFIALGNNATGQINELACAANGQTFTPATAGTPETSDGAGDAIAGTDASCG
ncbi:Flp family type IVb pilin [Colwellia sp. BRX10-3]|uniref:Flp family type IVb pilin n=1 Tax=Colwellia sp. BRX10-3 TaxID=2759844 RepID=UPI002174DC97|nr:Flp family type IVb pilin [Colwellia sp. BRX10-3]